MRHENLLRHDASIAVASRSSAMTLVQRETEAFTVWKRHGERASLYVDERISDLTMEKDAVGVEHWKEIAETLDTLMLGRSA